MSHTCTVSTLVYTGLSTSSYWLTVTGGELASLKRVSSEKDGGLRGIELVSGTLGMRQGRTRRQVGWRSPVNDVSLNKIGYDVTDQL